MIQIVNQNIRTNGKHVVVHPNILLDKIEYVYDEKNEIKEIILKVVHPE